MWTSPSFADALGALRQDAVGLAVADETDGPFA